MPPLPSLNFEPSFLEDLFYRKYRQQVFRPEAQMLAKKPEEVNQLFIEFMRNGDLESVLELYDPEMAFVNPAGEIKRGISAIRGELSELAATKQLFQFHIRNVIQNGNIALVHNQWEMISPRKASGYAIEVMRLQPDGGWRFFIGDPFTIH